MPRIGIGIGVAFLGGFIGITVGPGGVPLPPPGFVFLIDNDGAYLTDNDGAYLVEPI